MRVRIIHRVLVAIVLVSVVVFGVIAWLASRAQQLALDAQVERHALALSDTILSSTHYAMLLNERAMLRATIEQIGGQEELGRIHVHNKDGTIVYAADADAIGTVVDKRGAACEACHTGGGAASGLRTGDRTRRYVDAAGVRQLGVITPILNAPACSDAACHAHDAGQRVLGVLDVSLALTEGEREVAAARRTLLELLAGALVAIGLLLTWSFHRLVGRPVRRLVAATNAVAAGDLAHRIPVRRSDELSHLAESFNEMTAHLADARRQIYQSNKLASLGRLAAGIAHEINNPLTGVLTYSSFLLKRAADDETRQDLETIVHETKRCRDIVRGLLDFARQVPPKKTLVDVNPIVERALDLIDNQLRVQNIEVTRSLCDDLPRLEADPNQLQQVLINLLVNAADAFEGPSRQIYVATDLKTRDGRREIEIKVADNGVGIPEKDLGKIFEPFFTTKDNKGTGLGLAVVWGIVSEHGGTVEVESKAGRGTTFTVHLPLEPPAAGAPPEARP
jgi:two-component system, NtrC family, sensor kinase